MDHHKLIGNLKCPFFLNHKIATKPGKTTCPECSAEFEINDRLECIFVNTEKMRLPMNGFVCYVCGLVQGDQRDNCLDCGAALRVTMQ